MRQALLLAAICIAASGSLASAQDTVIRVQDGQLLVRSSDGSEVRCSSLTLSPAGKASATLCVAGQSVQLESDGVIVLTGNVRLRSAEPAKPAAK